MTNTASTDAQKQELSALAEMKMPLVIQDYESYFKVQSRSFDKILQLRGWEVTLVSGLAVVILTRPQNVPALSMVPLLAVIAVFWFLEVSTRADILVNEQTVRELEAKLQTQDLKQFQRNLVGWVFGNTLYDKNRPRRRRRYLQMVSVALRPTTLFWHGVLVFVIVVLALFIA